MANERMDLAEATFAGGFNCAQSVCAAFAPDLGLDRATALAAAGAFGGGMGWYGETCGALAGALVVLGLAYGKRTADDDGARDRCNAHVATLFEGFAARHGALRCRELIRCDLRDPVQHAAAKESGVFRETCPAFVLSAADLLEEILAKDPPDQRPWG